MFALELLRFADDHEGRARMGAAAAALVRRYYAPEVVMMQLTKCLKSAGAGAGKKAEPDVPLFWKGRRAGLFLFIMIRLMIPHYAVAETAAGRGGADSVVTAAFAPAVSIAGCVRDSLRCEDFGIIRKFSGSDSYYTVVSGKRSATVIRAEYMPPMKTVILGYRISEYPAAVTKVGWDWRIVFPPVGSSENIRGRNDSGASVYLLYKSGLKTYIIKYVFSATLPKGMILPKKQANPFQEMIMMVAGSLSEAAAGEWEHYEVDADADFRRVFTTAQSVPLSGIGILTDGDQTGSHVVAEYRHFTLCRSK